jgi:hypothetical protein
VQAKVQLWLDLEPVSTIAEVTIISTPQFVPLESNLMEVKDANF